MAVIVGVAVAALAFVLMPGWTRSSMADMGYWVDWLNLAAMVIGAGGVAAAFVWPLSVMWRSRTGNRLRSASRAPGDLGPARRRQAPTTMRRCTDPAHGPGRVRAGAHR
ncbi:MAG: hypothetical protein Q8K05_08320 [Polaromonas sp.]|uniref:hypothetical protein n=1 Tax=Polaromonas sp. TaxID=1869339 RepID=UPI00272F0DC8|nr:hypothetical protein [Polaromonas sp.]MDP2256044.1 hypothetical protein [Polaromonas sp.]